MQCAQPGETFHSLAASDPLICKSLGSSDTPIKLIFSLLDFIWEYSLVGKRAKKPKVATTWKANGWM